MPQAGFDPPFAEGSIYRMRKDDALTNQATTAGCYQYTKVFQCDNSTFIYYTYSSPILFNDSKYQYLEEDGPMAVTCTVEHI